MKLKDITVRITELNILLVEPFYFEKAFVLRELVLNNDVVLNTVNSSDRSCKRAERRAWRWLDARAANKSTFGRVTGLRGEMLYEIETRGPVRRPSP